MQTACAINMFDASNESFVSLSAKQERMKQERMGEGEMFRVMVLTAYLAF